MPVGPVSGTGVGGGGGLRIVEEFSATTLAGARAARDTHFAANPTELAELDANTNLLIRLDETTGNTSVWEFRLGGAWVIGQNLAQGPQGDIGPRGETFPTGQTADELLVSTSASTEEWRAIADIVPSVFQTGDTERITQAKTFGGALVDFNAATRTGPAINISFDRADGTQDSETISAGMIVDAFEALAQAQRLDVDAGTQGDLPIARVNGVGTLSSATPQRSQRGDGAVGTSTDLARADHRHQSANTGINVVEFANESQLNSLESLTVVGLNPVLALATGSFTTAKTTVPAGHRTIRTGDLFAWDQGTSNTPGNGNWYRVARADDIPSRWMTLFAGDGGTLAPEADEVLKVNAGGVLAYGDVEERNLTTQVQSRLLPDSPSDDQIARYDSATSAWVAEDLPATATGATTFAGLTDTPNSLTGQGGKYVSVNSGGTQLEFVDAPSAGTSLTRPTTAEIEAGTSTTIRGYAPADVNAQIENERDPDYSSATDSTTGTRKVRLSAANVSTIVGDAQTQSDWTETSTSNPAYIENKPTVYTQAQIEELARDAVGAALRAGTHITNIQIDDGANTITINADTQSGQGGGGLTIEQVRDGVAAFLQGTAPVTVTHDDDANTLTIAVGTASTTANGLMTSTDKGKLDGIAANAIASVTSDATLSGDGTSTSALSVANPFTAADETKLDGIATQATRNTDADIQELARDALGAALTAGSNITITPNDSANTITIASTASGGGLASVTSDATLTGNGTSGSPLSVANAFTQADETKLDGIATSATRNTDAEIDERARDAVGNALVGTLPITISLDDGNDTITIAANAASTSAAGVTEYATDIEAQGVASGSVALTPSNIAALLAAVAPLAAAATAAVGTSNRLARADHVHPIAATPDPNAHSQTRYLGISTTTTITDADLTTGATSTSDTDDTFAAPTWASGYRYIFAAVPDDTGDITGLQQEGGGQLGLITNLTRIAGTRTLNGTAYKVWRTTDQWPQGLSGDTLTINQAA